jgi:hypothetical protein
MVDVVSKQRLQISIFVDLHNECATLCTHIEFVLFICAYIGTSSKTNEMGYLACGEA